MPYKTKEEWNIWNQKRYENNFKILIELKSKPCSDCNKIYEHYQMQYDHVPERGTKKASVSALLGSRSLKAKTVQEEIAKCDLVCCNCHAKRTWLRGQNKGKKNIAS